MKISVLVKMVEKPKLRPCYIFADFYKSNPNVRDYSMHKFLTSKQAFLKMCRNWGTKDK
jgi:hypothetical protein